MRITDFAVLALVFGSFEPSSVLAQSRRRRSTTYTNITTNHGDSPIHDNDERNRNLNEDPSFQFSSSAHACLLAYDIVQCVGYNYYGQLGQSSSTAFGTPVQLMFPGVTSAKPIKVVTGYDHTCTLFNDGHVWCNGSNGFQQLGDETNVNSSTPVQVKKNGAVLKNVIDIEAGAYHNCAIQNTGAMYCWGFDTDGQLGMNAIMDGIYQGTSAVLIALSMSATCCIAESDATQVICVGYGYSSSDNASTTIDLGHAVTALTAGSTHFCALLDTTKAKCWGTNHKGQLGIGSAEFTSAYMNTPVFVLQDSTGTERSGISDINASYSSTCLVASGKPMCFGNNKYYQLGIANGGANVLYPTLVAPFYSITGKSLVSMHVGEYTGHAVFDDGSVSSVGTNNGGTFGDGSTIGNGNVVGDISGAIAKQISFVVGSSSPSLFPSNSPSSSPSVLPSLSPSSSPSVLPSLSPSKLTVCETFNHNGSTWRVNGNGESLSTFCSREDCCNGGGQYQCASFWSTNVSYTLCTGSCKGDRVCQGIANNASSGSVSIGPGSCSYSSTSAGNTCKNIANQNTGDVNVSIGARSCLDQGCGNIGDSDSAGTYVVSVGDNSCSSERSCSYAGGKNGPGDYSVSIGDNSCQTAFACWAIAYETITISGLLVPDNECNGADNICKFCGSGSVYTGIIEATSSCCSADGNIQNTSVDIECFPTYNLAFNVNPSDGNNAGYYSPMWNVNSNVGSLSQALSHDYKSVSAWSQQFQCLAVARHNGAGIADGIKVWKLSTQNTLANHFQSSDRAVMTSGGPVQVISESGVSYSTDPMLASSGVNNNLAFNWRHSNNGARVILSDVGHWSGTLSGETINDDDSHGIGNDLSCDHANQAASALWWHDAAKVQANCHGTSCTILGTDHGGEFTLVEPKFGNYAFLVSETDAGGNCPLASWYILQTEAISPSSTVS